MENNLNQSNLIIETYDVKIEYDDKNRKILNDYIFLNTLGKGSYGKVKLCCNLKTNQKYAVKILNKNLLKKKKKGYGRDAEGNMTFIYMLDDALNEISMLKNLNLVDNHINIVKLYEIIHDEDNGKIYLIMEYCSKGSIMEYNDRTGVFTINKNYKQDGNIDYSEDTIRGFLRDLAHGLDNMHSKNIIHRDIKTDNIIIDENGNCKFSDFNMTTCINNEDKFTKTEGNIYFYPPEFCTDKAKIFAGKPVDVWAVGVTAYIITFRQMPFLPENPSNLIELFKLIENADLKFPQERDISDGLKDLLKRLLEKDPNKRITAKEMIDHPWLSNNTII